MNRVAEDDAVRIPIWIRNTLVGGMIALAASGVTAWARVNANTESNARQDAQIIALQTAVVDIKTSVAAIHQEVKDTHSEVKDIRETQGQSGGKLDRILELEMAHK